MKRILLPVLLVFGFTIAINGQDVRNIAQERSTALRSDKSSLLNEHQDWPTRPRLSTFFNDQKQYYTRLEAKFAVTNDSPKKVKQVTWECTFIHPDTNKEIARYTLVVNKKIKPFSGAILTKKVEIPLTAFYDPKVVAADQAGVVKPDVPVQAVQVNKLIEIKYSDGSVKRP
ncbi:MAG TPA: hypothetical protein VN643_22885 [Pyrinomonadaceae bacterium]|nr:hypothetical protein [Pyrinomonadaceae bacterium]